MPRVPITIYLEVDNDAERSEVVAAINGTVVRPEAPILVPLVRAFLATQARALGMDCLDEPSWMVSVGFREEAPELARKAAALAEVHRTLSVEHQETHGEVI